MPALLIGLPWILAFQLAKLYAERERRRALRKSKVKIKGKDVIATYKVLIALVLTPVLHGSYTLLVWSQYSERAAVAYCFFAPFVSWWGLVRFGEGSFSAYREAFNVISVACFWHGGQRDRLFEMRGRVKDGVIGLIEELLALQRAEIAAEPGSGGSQRSMSRMKKATESFNDLVALGNAPAAQPPPSTARGWWEAAGTAVGGFYNLDEDGDGKGSPGEHASAMHPKREKYL